MEVIALLIQGQGGLGRFEGLIDLASSFVYFCQTKVGAGNLRVKLQGGQVILFCAGVVPKFVIDLCQLIVAIGGSPVRLRCP